MYKVFGDILSGNCYKIKLLMSFLDIEHQWVHVDILAGETRTAAFRKMNPNMKVPVLDLGDGRYLTESNAVLNLLAHGTALLPDTAYERARVLQWQFFEQYSHEPFIATARFINKYLGLPQAREAEYYGKHEGGYKALSIMDRQLADTRYLTGAAVTIADISLYAYTHVAHEGGFKLDDYRHIRRWIGDIESLPKYISMAPENA
jgi:glutathione S-transferase